MTSQKLIIIVGPTASGKSELAVQVAKKVGGAIISADSRQVYRGMDIGSGKVEGALDTNGQYAYKNIPHYGIDIASPRRNFGAAQFQTYTQKTIRDIAHNGLTPIICGGTAQWIDAVVFNHQFPKVKPDANLRKVLEQKTTEQLFKQLQKLDPERASEIDQHNPRRLIRALEIVLSSGQPVPKLSTNSSYDTTWLGILPEPDVLRSNIHKRLIARMRNNAMLDEVTALHESGLSWKRLEDFGLEYKYCALHLQNKLTLEEMKTQIEQASIQYAKRQMTWWKRNKDIQWFGDPEQALGIIK